MAKALLDPFVLALAQGTLPRSAFQAYIVEDNFFLRSFARGYEAAIASCRAVQPPALATAMQRKLEELLAGVKEELSLHEGYARGWGVDLSQHPVPSPSTRKYLEFLESITSRQPREVTCATNLPQIPHIHGPLRQTSLLWGF